MNTYWCMHMRMCMHICRWLFIHMLTWCICGCHFVAYRRLHVCMASYKRAYIQNIDIYYSYLCRCGRFRRIRQLDFASQALGAYFVTRIESPSCVILWNTNIVTTTTRVECRINESCLKAGLQMQMQLLHFMYIFQKGWAVCGQATCNPTASINLPSSLPSEVRSQYNTSCVVIWYDMCDFPQRIFKDWWWFDDGDDHVANNYDNIEYFFLSQVIFDRVLHYSYVLNYSQLKGWQRSGVSSAMQESWKASIKKSSCGSSRTHGAQRD